MSRRDAPAIKLVRHAGPGFAVGVVPPSYPMPQFAQVRPGAIVRQAHKTAVDVLAAGGACDEAVQALQTAWRAVLVARLQKPGHLREFTRLDDNTFLRPPTPENPLYLACACTDQEEAAGLCPRPIMADALRWAGHAVELDGVVLGPRPIRVALRSPPKEGAEHLAEESPCGHVHRTFATAWACAERQLSPPWSATPGSGRPEPGAAAVLLDHATGEEICRQTKTAPPDHEERRGESFDHLRWRWKRWHHARRVAPDKIEHAELELERNGLSYRLSWAAADHHSPKYAQGFADAMSVLLSRPIEYLQGLRALYHTPAGDEGKLITLAPPPAPAQPVRSDQGEHVGLDRPRGLLLSLRARLAGPATAALAADPGGDDTDADANLLDDEDNS